MNEYDVDEVAGLLFRIENVGVAEVPNLCAGALTMQRLVRWVNSNSDGWPYWRKPGQASIRLQGVLGEVRDKYMRDELEDITEAELKKLYQPIKAFLTRHGSGTEAVFPPPPPPEYHAPYQEEWRSIESIPEAEVGGGYQQHFEDFTDPVERNRQRALCGAYYGVHGYGGAMGSHDTAEAIGDLLSDLMHLSDALNVGFEGLLHSARNRYNEEVLGE